SWSYSELWDRSAQMARAIRSLPDYFAGCRIGLLGLNTPGYLAAYLGVIRSGAVVVPLNDRNSVEELGRQLEFVTAIGCLVGDVEDVVQAELSEEHAVWPLTALRPPNGGALARPASDSPAVILLTSGTTGQPK